MPATSLPARAVRVAVLLLVLAGALLMLRPGTASAASYPPGTGCTVSTTTVHAGPGDTVTLVGSGFTPHETVTLSIPSASAAIGSVTTTAGGSFRTTFTWPASVSGASAVVQASAPSTSCSFTLVNADRPQSNRHAGVTDGDLPNTGFATVTATTIAIVLIGGGLIFLGLARRRHVRE